MSEHVSKRETRAEKAPEVKNIHPPTAVTANPRHTEIVAPIKYQQNPRPIEAVEDKSLQEITAEEYSKRFHPVAAHLTANKVTEE